MQHVSDNIAGSDVKLRRDRKSAAEPSTERTAAASRKSVPTNSNSASTKRPTQSPRVRVSSGSRTSAARSRTAAANADVPIKKGVIKAFDVLPEKAARKVHRDEAGKVAGQERGEIIHANAHHAAEPKDGGGKPGFFKALWANAARRILDSRIAKWFLG